MDDWPVSTCIMSCLQVVKDADIGTVGPYITEIYEFDRRSNVRSYVLLANDDSTQLESCGCCEEIDLHEVQEENSDNYRVNYYHKLTVTNNQEKREVCVLRYPPQLQAIIDKVPEVSREQIRSNFKKSFKNLHDSLQDQNTSMQSFKICDNIAEMHYWLHHNLSTTPSVALENGTDYEELSQYSLPKHMWSSTLAWIYFTTRLLSIIKAWLIIVQRTEFPHLLDKLVITFKPRNCDANPAGYIGITHGSTVVACEVMKLKDGNEDCHAVVEYPEPLQILDRLCIKGKFSESECRHEKEKCFAILKQLQNLTCVDVNLQERCIFVDGIESREILRLAAFRCEMTPFANDRNKQADEAYNSDNEEDGAAHGSSDNDLEVTRCPVPFHRLDTDGASNFSADCLRCPQIGRTVTPYNEKSLKSDYANSKYGTRVMKCSPKSLRRSESDRSMKRSADAHGYHSIGHVETAYIEKLVKSDHVNAKLCFIMVQICDVASDSENEASWKLFGDCESDSEVVLQPSTNMILAAFRQSGIISDVTSSKLSKLRTYNGKRHTRAEIVLNLIIFCVSNLKHRYPKFVETLSALQHRASDATYLLHEDQNLVAVLEPKQLDAEDKAESTVKATSQSNDIATKKMAIVGDVLFTVIDDKKYLPYDFEIKLRQVVYEHKVDVSNLRNKDGYSLLHFIVINNRPQFILPIFRTGCWKAMKPLTVENNRGNEHQGKTADDIAAILHLRKVQKELDTYSVWEKSLNLLHVEARNGNLERVQHWLQYSSDLHTELDSMQCTTLYWACIGGNLDIVKLLLKLKVDYRQVNSRKENLLHAACMLGHHHLIETLVKECNMDFTVKDAAKKSPLLRVSENGDEKSLAKLLECGLKVDVTGGILAIAGHYGRLNFIRILVEKYRIHPQSKDEAGKSALLRAAEQGRIEVLKYLFSKNIDFEEADVRKRNILHVIADGASREVMEFVIVELKSKNVNLKRLMNARDKYIGGELCMLIRGKDKGRDSWHYVEVSRALMDIFMKKTRGGTIDVAKYGTLLHSGWGADPDEASAREIERRFETRRNANSIEDADSTPLHIAAFKDKVDVAEVLLDNGADPNIRDKFGMTPLHVAAMRGNMKLVQRLVDGGSTADALDTMVKTPAEVAEDNEHKDVSNYLKGVRYLPIAAHFRERVLPNVAQVVSPDSIRAVHESGQDLRTHLINLLRDLTVDINETLLSLGSGPVLEESSSRQHLAS